MAAKEVDFGKLPKRTVDLAVVFRIEAKTE
jgi:hypothetical protein